MIVKSIVAGVVLAGLAGGGVYYGLSPDGVDSFGVERPQPITPKNVIVKKVAKADHPHSDKTPKVKETKKSKTETPESIKEEAKAPESIKAEDKKWIDQYLDPEKPDPRIKTTTTKTVETTITNTDETKKRAKTDVASNDESEDDKKVIYKTAKPEAIIIGDVDRSAEVIKDVERLLKDLQMENSANSDTVKTIIRIKADERETATMKSFETLNIIIREAEQIQSVDLKDRAYLSVVDYALAHGYFGEAKEALPSINQSELRETARSRIAVKYASTGNPDAAFGLVDSVEIDDFKDPMRIQIIEALIGADPMMRRDK